MNRETFSEACLQALNEELEVFAPIRCTVNPHSRFIGSMLGTYGIEPELDYPLDVFFDEAKEDIDNYLAYAKHGRNGGRGNKKKAANVDDKRGVKSPLPDDKNGALCKQEDPFKAIPILSLPNLTNPINKEEEESFPLQCLKALNEELRSSLERCKPADCWRTARPKRSGGKP
jgi:hypothetical protein